MITCPKEIFTQPNEIICTRRDQSGLLWWEKALHFFAVQPTIF